MREKELTKLRRARIRVHRQLDRLEPLVAGYRAKIARNEARIQEIAPELPLAGRHREPNPVFGRAELPRLALAILRDVGGPLPVAVIASMSLARKGVPLPDPKLRRQTRRRLQQVFAAFERKGLTVKVGRGKETRRGLGAGTPCRVGSSAER